MNLYILCAASWFTCLFECCSQTLTEYVRRFIYDFSERERKEGMLKIYMTLLAYISYFKNWRKCVITLAGESKTMAAIAIIKYSLHSLRGIKFTNIEIFTYRTTTEKFP